MGDTTKIDKFLVSDKKEVKSDKDKIVDMKKVADSGVHDEFIASTAAMKTMGRFNQLVDQAQGMVEHLNTPALQKAMLGHNLSKEQEAEVQKQKTEGGNAAASQKQQAVSDQRPVPAQKRPDADKVNAVDAEKAKADKFVAAYQTQVQPTKAKAVEALQQEK